MSTHTKGPWKAEFYEDGGYDCMSSAFRISAEGQFCIAEVDVSDYTETHDWETEHSRHPLAEANARLIAQSPVLLANLRECVKWLCRLDDGESDCLQDAIENARVVIAAAEGRS